MTPLAGTRPDVVAAIVRFQERVLTAPDEVLGREARRGWRELAAELDLVDLEFRAPGGPVLATSPGRRLDEGWLERRTAHVPATLRPGTGARWGREWSTTALATPAGRLVAVGPVAAVPDPVSLELLACAGAAAAVRWRQADEARRERSLASLGARAGGRLHDLRNQLTLALFHAERAAEEGAREELVGDLRRARELAADGLAGELGDSGDATDARPMRRIPLRALLLEEARALGATARAEGARVRVRCPAGLEALGEPTVLGRLVRNLLLNAAESRSGGAAVRVEARRVAPHRVELAVRDDGRGMDRAALDGYLDAGRSDGGTGFGTASVAEALERLDADLEVASAPGRGTRVALGLWAAPPAAARVALIVDPVPEGSRAKVAGLQAGDVEVRVHGPLQALALLDALRPARVEVHRAALGSGRRRLRGAAARAGVPLVERSLRPD